MKKTIKKTRKQIKYVITFPDGTKMVPGHGNVPTSHEGVAAKDFSKALEKAAKAVSDAGIFDSEGEIYGNRFHATAR